MTAWIFTAIPLSPIHVGDGTVWPSEEIAIDDGALVRFEPTRVLQDMSLTRRNAYLQALHRGELLEAQRQLRDSMDPSKHGLERLPVPVDASADIDEGLSDRGRRTDVHPFVRGGGKPYLPGSSLKGAIRTALVNLFAQQESTRLQRELETADRQRRHETLERIALNRESPNTQEDALRFLSIADAELPSGLTRIDRVENWRPMARAQRNPARGIRMYFERTKSVADLLNPNELRFQVKVTLDEDRMQRVLDFPERGRIGRRFSAHELWNAVNDFYWRRWRAELDGGEVREYFKNQSGTKWLLERTPRSIKWRSGGTMAETGPPRFGESPEGKYILLRVGRFSHFESLSVERFRRGVAPQTQTEMTEGSTRSVIELRRDGASFAPVPFGWLLLLA